MPRLIYKQRTYPQVCLGDMIHRITIYDRSITAPVDDSGNYGLEFHKIIRVWANVKTTSGEVIFDSVNMDRTITHKILIRYLPFLTQEYWVTFEKKYLDIVKIEDLNEEHRFQMLYCNLRGSKIYAANEA